MAEKTVIDFSDELNFIFDPLKIEFVSLRAKLVEVTPGNFPTDNPTIVTKTTLPVNSLFGFLEDATKPTGTEIKYILSVDDVDQYHDGTNWTASDGTFSQSNLATEIDINRRTFPLSGNIKVITFLNSDGTDTPII